MYKTLSINAVTWLSYLESEDFRKNGINQILEIYYRDHLRLVVQRSGNVHADSKPRVSAIRGQAELISDEVPEEADVEEGKGSFALLQQEGKLFSKREKEVLLWMAEGLSSKMIAGKLHISEHTVINHRRSMQEKSNKPNATALVSYAIRSGII